MAYHKWSLGYALIKALAKWVYLLSWRRIEVHGLKNIPKNKPVIFAPNHQNALSDTLSVIYTAPVQTVWLARADIFKKPFLRALFQAFKMHPVYRMRDGVENLGRNDEVFALTSKLMEHNKYLALFPEAGHSERRKSISHKKAIPRIVLAAEQANNFSLDIKVVPVGIYYSHYYKTGADLLVQYGEPISVLPFKDALLENHNKGMMQLRKAIQDALIPLTLEIPSSEYYNEQELWRSVVPSQKTAKKGNLQSRFKEEQDKLEYLRVLEDADKEAFTGLMGQLKTLKSLMDEVGLRNEDVQESRATVAKLLGVKMGVLISLPLLLLGYVTHSIPYLLPVSFTRKKVKQAVFYGTFEFVLRLILLLVFYVVYFMLIQNYFSTFYISLAALILLSFSGWFAIHIGAHQFRFLKRYVLCNLSRNKSKKVDEIYNIRKSIIDQFLRAK